MQFDPSAHRPRDAYRLMIDLITPRPIAWVSTISGAGVVNLAPYSFFNGVSADPPTVAFSAVNRRDGTPKDTVRNVEENGGFVVNVATFDLREAMNATSEEVGYDVSELERCGLHAMPSERVLPPRVAEAKASFECVLHQIVRVGEGPLAANLVIGRIVLIHAADAVVRADGTIDPEALDTIGRLGGSDYTRTRERFTLPRPDVRPPGK